MTQYVQPPAPGDLFPLLKETDLKTEESVEPDPDQDNLIFQMVTASMATPSK